MWSQWCTLAYRTARQVMTLDIVSVVWLDRARLVLPRLAETALTFRFLDPAEVREFAGDPAADLAAPMASRICTGRDYCFAALDGNRLACYAWFALGSIEAEYHRGSQPHSGVAVSFPPNVAFMYKGFTHPLFRGRSLYGAVVSLGLAALETHGIDTVLSTMDWTNQPARRALRKVGAEELGLCYRWGWSRWMHTWPPREALRRGACFGTEAAVERRQGLPPLRPRSIG
jgi:hypothetical protein